MTRSRRLILLGTCLLLSFAAWHQSTLWQVVAQDVPGNSPQNTDSRQRLDEGIPPAAWLTDRGRELAENLRNLRRTRANLGAKHPTLPVIEQAIAETEQQLRAWLPNDPVSENPFKDLESPPQNSLPAPQPKKDNAGINETDLRQLVLRLHARIEALEARVRTLEQSPR